MAMINVLQNGRSGMTSSKAGIATAGHNIANANTEGFSRQRVQIESNTAQQLASQQGPYTGQGSRIRTIERINDDYLEKQLRQGNRDLAFHEEKQVFLNQIEDTFNEMNGDGLNRLVAKFFNDFRKLSNDPTSEAVRQALRESAKAMTSDFKRIHEETNQIRGHIDNRVDGYMGELNSMAHQVANLNMRIRNAEVGEHQASDLRDQRDLILQKMSALMDITVHPDNQGMMNVEIRNVGPLITGPNVEEYHVQREPGVNGSYDNSFQISRSGFGSQYVTDQIRGGKIGALLETRDQAINTVNQRLDELAYSIASSVNQLHEQGFTADGLTGISFFKDIGTEARGAAGRLDLSDEIKGSVANIAVALQVNAPGDNRNALAIANIQNLHVLNDGRTTLDDYYNSIISDIGVASSRNAEAAAQQKAIMTQLSKVRDQVSGVSIDEETSNLMQFQHAFDASARVIRVADEMMDTVLKLRG